MEIRDSMGTAEAQRAVGRNEVSTAVSITGRDTRQGDVNDGKTRRHPIVMSCPKP
jgi:hypothetical protein